MKKLTKISSLVLSLLTAFSVSFGAATFAGCNNDNQTEPPQADVGGELTPPEENPVKPSVPLPEPEKITVGIDGMTEVKSGQTLQLTAVVGGTDNKAVDWKITKGGEFAKIDASGLVTAGKVDSDKLITVRATSKADVTAKGEAVINLTAERRVTQAMLDKLNSLDEISFDGFINIKLYNISQFETINSTYVSPVKTAMDGTNWYAEYESSASNTKIGMYYRNHDNLACQVGVNFMNEESYVPMLDNSGQPVSWEDAGLYNSLKDLTAADFEFNPVTWRNEYVGRDVKLAQKIIASSNPYEFIPKGFSLIVEDDEIIGVYSEAEPDYTVVQGFKAVQELYTVINYGETVKTPTIAMYGHHEVHDKLATAIENMHSLTSYTLDFKRISGTSFTSGYTQDGFIETVTKDECLFNPFNVRYDNYGNEVHDSTGEYYGYRKLGDNFYNSFVTGNDGKYAAARAYEDDFENAKPSFAFAAEIFTAYYEDKEDGTTTYYVDNLMCPVASTFYYGVGNDIALYGIYAAEGRTSATSTFTPYVVVKDGYIIQSAFYFYLGYLYGVIEIDYSDFDTAELPDVNIEFETRQVPSKWSQLTIQDTFDENFGEEKEINAVECIEKYLGITDVEETLPFFGSVLGDTYGFGMTTLRTTSDNRAKRAINFYYDVPLDTDYSIDSSLKKLDELLTGSGFVKNRFGEYKRGNLVVNPVDSDLDLMIYVWTD